MLKFLDCMQDGKYLKIIVNKGTAMYCLMISQPL